MNSRTPNLLAPRSALLGVAAAVVAFALIILSMSGQAGQTAPAAVASNVTLGVDVTTDGNSGAALGTIDACKRVNSGASFDVDFYITDVTDLRGWEYFIDYDGSLLTLTAQEFLMVNGFDASDPVPDSSGKHFLGVGNTSAVSGSGVLARLTFQASGTGSSIVAIAHNPKWPALNPGSDPIGDTSGDGYFDGPLIAGRIAVGQDCAGDPVVTPSPGPTIAPPTTTPSPTPSPSPAPGPMKGDANCNRLIDLSDVVITLKGAAGTELTGDCWALGDTNCSNILDPNDVLLLLRHIVGSPLAPPGNCPLIGVEI